MMVAQSTHVQPLPRVRLANLQAWREASDLEVSKLASLTGSSRRILSRLEMGELCTERLAQHIADALGVTLEQLTDPDLAPDGPHTYVKRIRVFTGVGQSGRAVTLFWADYAWLATWAPERPNGFRVDEIAERAGLDAQRVADICDAVIPATHRELTQIAHAVGMDVLQLLTTD